MAPRPGPTAEVEAGCSIVRLLCGRRTARIGRGAIHVGIAGIVPHRPLDRGVWQRGKGASRAGIGRSYFL